MIETTEEGFKILAAASGIKFFMFSSDRILEGVDFVRRNNYRYVGINSFMGFNGTDISFLSLLSDFIEGITIPENFFDLSVVNDLRSLVFLGFADNGKSVIDLSNFPLLSTLACDYSPRVVSLEGCEQLNHLSLTGYKSKSEDLRELPRLSSLTELDLFGTNISTFKGVGKFPTLRTLKVYRARNLKELSGLAEIKNSLSTFELENSRRVQDFSPLEKLIKLERLLIANCGSISSISFVKKLPELKFLSFVGTNVVDGDLSPTVGLGYVGFENKSHYSHTFEEISKVSGI